MADTGVHLFRVTTLGEFPEHRCLFKPLADERLALVE
jgi:hypothetical protein